jgi:two-component system, NtrC family, response regulator AtoC
LILETLRANNWNRKDAARKLKISYRSMMYKLKEAGVPPKRRHLQDSSE